VGTKSISLPPPISDSSVRKQESRRAFNTSKRHEFLEEGKFDLAIHHAGQTFDDFQLEKFPCPLITIWHNDPTNSLGEIGSLVAQKTRLNFFPIKNILSSRVGEKLCDTAFHVYKQLGYLARILLCDRFVVLSDSFIPLVWASKIFPKKVVAISNPASFPRAEVDFSQKKRELLFVGRMENGQKRVDLLLKIWAKLEARFPDWSLRLVGDGNDLPANKKLAESLGLRRAFFEGFQNPEKYYREASIFCMTSAYEGFGMVLVESAAFGCVPVAFDSFAAVRDIISDGENGVLVPAFDLDAYAEKLAQLMSDDALRERLAQTALSQIPEKFSPKKIVAKWENLFAEIL